MSRVIIGALDDFPDGQGVRIEAGGWAIAIFRTGARLFAIADACPHRGFPLNDGVFDGRVLRCRTHGSCFDLETGDVLRGPASKGVRTYAITIVGDQVELEV